jgi:hypothetical protein
VYVNVDVDDWGHAADLFSMLLAELADFVTATGAAARSSATLVSPR